MTDTFYCPVLWLTSPFPPLSVQTCYSLDLILEEVGHRDDPVNIPGHIRVQTRVAAAPEHIVTESVD